MKDLGEVSMRVLRFPELITRIGMGRSTIYDWMNPKSPRYDNTFPKKIKMGYSSVGWLESDVDFWIKSRIEKSHI